MPQVPPPSAAKVDQQQIRNSKLFAPEFPFDEKWRNFAKDDRVSLPAFQIYNKGAPSPN
jgi:hypothetical protein